MVLYRLFLIPALWWCIILPCQAQSVSPAEICDNQQDDDGDGYVDCYDPDCHCFTGEDCSVEELPSEFRVRLAWQSAQNGPSVTAVPLVANMNPQTDSLPEIIICSGAPNAGSTPNQILFFRGDGSNAANPFVLTVSGGINPYPAPGPSIGDINGDGSPELIMTCNDRRIRVYRNYTENPTAPMSLWMTSTGMTDFPDQRPLLADFDGDGIAEIYAGSDIFQFNFSNPASPTLLKVISGPAYIGQAVYSNYAEGSCNPTAVDILSVADCNGDPDCAGLELVAGPAIYSIDLNPNDGDGYQIKTMRDLNQLAGGGNYADGYTAVADINLDGVLDIVVSSKRGNNQFGVYAWNKTGLLRFFPYPGGNMRSGSLACIANLYDDRTAGFAVDMPEIVVCNAYNLNCFNIQAAQANPAAPYWWSLPTEDFSGFTGSTVYDFNGDGISELVYRDEDHLRILYGGATPFPVGVDTERNWFKLPCGSITSDEYPVVADVDNDGETEIAVTGYTFSGYNNPASDYRGRLRVFESDADPWVPCRNVWNQFNYFIVNVNDDLSIPAQQQLHHLEFPTPGSGNRPFNRYLSQRPLLNENFQTFLPVPDALASVESVRCDGDFMEVRLRICNSGSHTLPAGTPVAFYNGDPTSTNADLIDASQVLTNHVEKDSCALFVFKLPKISGAVFGVVNDNGALPGPFDLALDFPTTTEYECNWLNNLFQFDISFPQSNGIAATPACPDDSTGVALFLGATHGLPPYQLLWNTSDTIPSLNGLAAGLYELTLTDARGCTLAESVEVTSLEAPILTPTLVHASCAGVQDGSISVELSGGDPGFTLLWPDSSTSPLLQQLGPGMYALTVTYADGACEQFAVYEITAPTAIISNGMTATAACPGVNNGSAYFGGAQQGTPPYTIMWSNGSDAATLTGLEPAMYSLTITDANGCNIIDSIEVPAYEAPVLTADVQHVSCFDQSNGRIAVDLSGGTPGFGFKWSNSATTPFIDALPAGAYQLTLTFADSACVQTLDFIITQPLALQSNGIAVTPTCPDTASGSLTFLGAFQGTPPYNLLWSNDSTATSLSSLSPGTFQLTLTDAHGCSLVESAEVPEHPAIALQLTTQNPLCAAGNDGWIDLNVSAGTPPFTYMWSNSAIVEDPQTLPAGNYAVTVRDANGCTLKSAVTLTEPLPLLSNGISTIAACPGEANGAVQFLGAAQGTAPYTLLWSTGGTLATLPAIPTGAYSLTITDAHGCSLIDTAVVPEYPATLLEAATIHPLCNGGTDGQIDLLATGGTAPFAFLWSNGMMTEDVTSVAAGIYSVTTTDQAGCTQTGMFQITEPAALSLQASVLQADTCAQNSGSLSAFTGGGTAPYMYVWSNGIQQDQIAGLAAGSYSLTVTDAHNCTLSADVTVPTFGINPTILPFTDTITCAHPVATIGVTADQSDLQFFWTGPQGMLQDQAIQPATLAGQYAVTVTNDFGCTAIALILLEEDKALPIANAGPELLSAPCGTASVTLDASGSSSGALFSNQWIGFHGNVPILDTPALIVNVQEPGTYIHTVHNLRNGCTAADTVFVQWENPISASLRVDSITCYGENDGRIQLTNLSGGSPPYQYSIDGIHFTGNPNFFNLSPGIYPVHIRDPFGCQWSEEVVLLEPEEIRVSLLASDSVIQLGQAVRLEAIPAPAGFGLSGIIWQPNGLPYAPMSLQQTLRPSESTEFSIQIFDLRGCAAADRVFVRVDNYQIYAPNVIFPGRDFNDAFTIFSGDGLVEIRLMRVYDRWGGLVFENRDFSPNELSYGWDGTYRGEPVNPGVFAWYAEVLMRNGQVRLLKGDVTVLR